MFPRRFGGGFLLGRHAPKADSLSLGERRRRKTASRKGVKVHVDSQPRYKNKRDFLCRECGGSISTYYASVLFSVFYYNCDDDNADGDEDGEANNDTIPL